MQFFEYVVGFHGGQALVDVVDHFALEFRQENLWEKQARQLMTTYDTMIGG